MYFPCHDPGIRSLVLYNSYILYVKFFYTFYRQMSKSLFPKNLTPLWLVVMVETVEIATATDDAV